MNRTKMVELLRGKIDSLERWKQVCTEGGTYWDDLECGAMPSAAAFHYGTLRYINSPRHMDVERTWWMRREVLRQAVGVYLPMSEVMTTVVVHAPHLQGYFVHISKEDPTLVAYTPTPEDGARDKQVRLSFGKLLRKLCPLFSDEHIQQLEASHRSEMDPTFKVATTPEEIYRVYTQMAGDSGCMRYPSENWNLPNGVHPSNAYAYAGLAVAYTEHDGIIKSRSVIYDNPANPEDKRYVRIYGDPSLKRKLELAGYRCDNLQGAKLRAVDLRKIRDQLDWDPTDRPYLVPYLDGAAGDQGQSGGSYGYIIEGEDCIRLIDSGPAERLSRITGVPTPRLKTTDARFMVPTVRAEQLQFTCAISGETCNTLETEAVYLWHGGEVKLASAAYKPRFAERMTHFLGTMAPDQPLEAGGNLRRAGTTQITVWVPAGERAAISFMERHHIGTFVLNTPQNRAICNMVKLHESCGPDLWMHINDAVEYEGAYYNKAACSILFDEKGEQKHMPQVAIDAMRKAAPKDWVNTAPNGSIKAVSHVRNPKMVVTVGKRRCIQGWHNILQLHDGSWDYAQNVRRVSILGFDVYLSKTHSHSSTVRLSEEQIKQLFSAYIEAASFNRTVAEKVADLHSFARERLVSGFSDQHFFTKGNAIFRGSYWSGGADLDRMRQAVVMLKAMADQQIVDTWDQAMVPIARGWQHHAELLFKIVDEMAAAWQASTPAPTEPATEWGDLDTQLTTVATHIADERFAAAA